MSFLSIEPKTIFVHVQRTGGTSLSRTLKPLCHCPAEIPLHPPAQWLRANYPIQWEESFTFGFVRNPFDLWVSWYCGRGDFNERWPTFREWMLDYKSWHHQKGFQFQNQAGHLCDENWRVMVDFVGRYENIEEDFGRVCKRIGIETPRLLHINNSKIPHGDYREYYDADTRAIVEKISEPTLRIFGYAY